MDEALIDSDILSEIIKGQNQRVAAATRRYLSQYPRLGFSAITLYERARGFIASNATAKLASFVQFAARSEVLPVSIPVLSRAALLWAEPFRAGHPRGDADIIIAATALEANRTLVTGNTGHFEWIAGLRLLDWRVGLP